MNASPKAHRALKWSLGTLAVVLVLLGLGISALAFVDANHFRGPLTRYIASHTGRDIRFDGPLEAHLLSLHPSFVAEQVTIGNPPWSAPGNFAQVSKLTVVIDLPVFSHPFALRTLELEGAKLRFQRDAAGHANWHWKAPGILPGKGLPLIYSLSIPNAHVAINDDRRHLEFDGTLSTDVGGSAGSEHGASATPLTARSYTDASHVEPLHLAGKGHLNGHDVTIAITGDPLATIARDKPFHFTLDERSSGSHLTGHGTLTQPFDFRYMDASFEANGEDLKDLYFLVGVRLPNTGTYRISGDLSRHFTTFKLDNLHATTGESDVHGTLTSEMSDAGEAHTDIDLHSKLVRLADFGLRAAGRATEPPAAKPLLLPETEIRLDGIRRSDSVLNFHLQDLDAGKLSFRSVTGKMTTDHGTVTLPNLSAKLAPDNPDGKLTASLKFDGKTNTPVANLDLQFSNLRLGQFARKDPAQPPLDGLLQGHLKLTGHGRSIHEIAADANGTLTATLPQGAMRESFAELSGIDFRGLGLMLTKSKEDTPIRCGVARFEAHDGTLTAQTLIIDTDPVLITGSGTIQLDSEALDLQIEGHPKHLRMFRLRAPVSVHGTLRHPAFGLVGEHKKLEVVDPGHAKDADCQTLLAEAQAP